MVSLSWRYLPTVLASSLIMLGWALIINNLGRRRYPLHWWAAGVTFVRSTDDENHQAMRQDEEAQAVEEEREEHEEGSLAIESDVDNASFEPSFTRQPRSLS